LLYSELAKESTNENATAVFCESRSCSKRNGLYWCSVASVESK